jgi:hypothetical protein
VRTEQINANDRCGALDRPTSGRCGAALALTSRSYTLTKTIVHGLLVLVIWRVAVSIPFAWLILNGTIVSVFCSVVKPSSALAA